MFGKGAPRCPRCQEAVYLAEEVIGAGAKWHNTCFSCKKCKKFLSSQTLSEKEGEIYCNNCYGALFGPKGYSGVGGVAAVATPGASSTSASSSRSPPPSFSSSSSSSSSSGAGASSVSSSSSSSSSSRFCTNCGSPGEGKFCQSCGTPRTSSSSTPSSTTSSSSTPVSSRVGSYPASSSSSSSSFSSSPSVVGASDKCGKCSKTVYAAERVKGAGRIYHESCFTCATCKIGLNSQTLSDKDGIIYCNTCYSKNFGPKGYGFAGGSGNTLAYTK